MQLLATTACRPHPLRRALRLCMQALGYLKGDKESALPGPLCTRLRSTMLCCHWQQALEHKMQSGPQSASWLPRAGTAWALKPGPRRVIPNSQVSTSSTSQTKAGLVRLSASAALRLAMSKKGPMCIIPARTPSCNSTITSGDRASLKAKGMKIIKNKACKE